MAQSARDQDYKRGQPSITASRSETHRLRIVINVHGRDISSTLTRVQLGEIRDAVVGHLKELHPDPSETLIRCELGLCLGETRVDVAAVNGQISGWEIKSPQDRLSRLPRQAILYSRVLDEAVIVAAGRHIHKVESLVPKWWGIVWAEPSESGEAVLTYKRRPKQNKDIDPFAVAQLLWRDETYQILKCHGLHSGLAKATRWRLWQELADGLPISLLKSEVRHQLRARQEW